VTFRFLIELSLVMSLTGPGSEAPFGSFTLVWLRWGRFRRERGVSFRHNWVLVYSIAFQLLLNMVEGKCRGLTVVRSGEVRVELAAETGIVGGGGEQLEKKLKKAAGMDAATVAGILPRKSASNPCSRRIPREAKRLRSGSTPRPSTPLPWRFGAIDDRFRASEQKILLRETKRGAGFGAPLGGPVRNPPRRSQNCR